MRIKDVGSWDEYSNKNVNEALPEMYKHAKKFSEETRSWYWKSIKSKRLSSQITRFLSVILLICGVILPLLSGLFTDATTRLNYTQTGVITLAIAGLIQAADRIFGWSSGWLRYIMTVTEMESITRKFDLDWANYMINKTGQIEENDKRALFELVKQLENNIIKLQSDETQKWFTEFSNSMTLLNDLIKTQRESAEKAVENAQSKLDEQKPGGIEITLKHKADPLPVLISIDENAPDSFAGTIWSKLNISPGQHTVCISIDKPVEYKIKKIVEIPSGGTAKVEINL